MNIRRALTFGYLLAAGLLLAPAAGAAGEAQAKRVLIVHSFGSTAPPFTTHSTAFERTLTREMGKRVDLDEVSLDMARYAQPDMEEPFVELLLKRLSKWRPDLVVPIGSPAGRFVAKYRHRLFPATPVIYTGMDRRTLPPGAFENATFVGEDFKLAGLVEDILQLKPDTDHIVVILGASPLERYWTAQAKKDFAPFENRVRFTWINDLTFDQMLELAATLPPRSFMLLALLLRDAAGVTHNEDEALQRLHAVASVPINGLYQHQLGLGIVGGRLYQAELQGEESARIALRILRGEPVASFPPLIIGTQQPRYDWRELQRWNIPADRLPPGSTIAFRQPTAWERYRWWVLGILGVGLAQAALIFLLAAALRRRRRAEVALRESEQRLNLAADSAGAGLWSLDLATGRLWTTPRLHEMFQVPAGGEATVRQFLERVHPEDRLMVSRAFGVDAEPRPDVNIEFRIVLPDGLQRWVGTLGHLEGGATSTGTRWNGAVIDITERKLTEAETLRLRQELTHISRVATMGQLTAAIVHELSQPLAAILTNAQAGLRGLAAGNYKEREVREILEDVVANEERAHGVITRLRSMFQRRPIEHRPLRLDQLIHEVVDVARRDAERRRVTMVLDLAADGLWVRGDGIQLQQVVLNLIVNGFDAIDEMSGAPRRLILRTRPLGADCVQIDVADTGPGIPAEKLTSLFKPFVTTKADGMGIGLSISQSIVLTHQGRLWAENGPDGGAVFHVVLPVSAEAPPAT